MRYVTGMQFGSELYDYVRANYPDVPRLIEWLKQADISETVFTGLRGTILLNVYSASSLINNAFITDKLTYAELIDDGLYRYKLGWARQLYSKYGFNRAQVDYIMQRAEQGKYFLTLDEAMFVAGEPKAGFIGEPEGVIEEASSDFILQPEQAMPSTYSVDVLPVDRAYQIHPEMKTGQMLYEKAGMFTHFRTYEEKEDVKTERKPKGLLNTEYNEVPKY